MGRSKILNEESINNIVTLYSSGTVKSIHKLGEMFGVAHKKISMVLKEYNIDIRNKGGQKKYPDLMYQKYQQEDGFLYKAIHKVTGEVFDDVNNVSGILTKYISTNNPEFNIPKTESEKKKYYLNNGCHWYEQFFNIEKIVMDNSNKKMCPYCSEHIDVDKSYVKYKNHLTKEHKIDINKHVEMHKDDFKLFEKDILMFKKNNDSKNWVECKICNKKYSVLNSKHLSKHNITPSEYRIKFGSNLSYNYLSDLSDRMKELNNSGVMVSYVSKPEKSIRDFLDSINIKYETNICSLIGKEIDILNHENKIGIEFNGNKWHTEWFGKKDMHYHLNKTKSCNKNGYNLLHIFEDEFQYKNEIVLNKLKHIFNKNNNLPKVPGRKCIIKEIDSIDSSCFLNQFHIQGHSKSSVYLGAFYYDKLVGVMAFKRLLNDSSEYDLTRFATDYNYICQGVGSKLLSYFIKNYKPSSIISFADRRWTLNKDNNLYTKLGFSLVGIIKPDYKYYNEKVDRYARFHKFSFRKKTLSKKYGLDINLTETEMVKILGYDRIWDCGLFKYEMKIE